MKKKRGYLSLLSLFVFVAFITVMEVNAINTGFETNNLPIEDVNKFISNSNILRIDKEPTKENIKCFDVSSNHLIAIGQNASNRNTICIYSNDGVFQYGYTFNCSGDFGVEWDEENLNIYFVRSAVIVSVTPTGEILEVLEVQNTAENNSYVNHFIHATERKIDDTEYAIGNDVGILNWLASSYSQIVVKDSSGAENIIYDVGKMQFSNMIGTIAIICVVVSVAIAAIAWQFIKLLRKTGHGSVS